MRQISIRVIKLEQLSFLYLKKQTTQKIQKLIAHLIKVIRIIIITLKIKI
jgi:hypothetical protein